MSTSLATSPRKGSRVSRRRETSKPRFRNSPVTYPRHLLVNPLLAAYRPAPTRSAKRKVPRMMRTSRVRRMRKVTREEREVTRGNLTGAACKVADLGFKFCHHGDLGTFAAVSEA